eukprot:780946-Pleurochrysis_carterae.AAC.1
MGSRCFRTRTTTSALLMKSVGFNGEDRLVLPTSVCSHAWKTKHESLVLNGCTGTHPDALSL